MRIGTKAATCIHSPVHRAVLELRQLPLLHQSINSNLVVRSCRRHASQPVATPGLLALTSRLFVSNQHTNNTHSQLGLGSRKLQPQPASTAAHMAQQSYTYLLEQVGKQRHVAQAVGGPSPVQYGLPLFVLADVQLERVCNALCELWTRCCERRTSNLSSTGLGRQPQHPCASRRRIQLVAL